MTVVMNNIRIGHYCEILSEYKQADCFLKYWILFLFHSDSDTDSDSVFLREGNAFAHSPGSSLSIRV